MAPAPLHISMANNDGRNQQTRAKKKQVSPNVIFVLADDQGCDDLEIYRNPWIKTPNMDKLAGREFVKISIKNKID